MTALASPGPRPLGDEGPLLAYASRLLDGTYAQPHTMDAVSYLWHGPGIPVVLAPFRAAGIPLTVTRFAGALALFAAVVAFERMLRLRLSPPLALAGAFALGLYAPFLITLPSIHKEPFALLAMALAALWLARYLSFGRRREMALAGAALGALAMIRVEYGWVIVALLGFCVGWRLVGNERTGPSRYAAVLGVALAACLPWLAYTFDLTGRPFYWGNSGGTSLYWMSPTAGPGQSGQWHSGHAVFHEPALAGYRPYSIRLGRLAPLARDLELQRSALSNIRARPPSYVRNVAANLGRLWFMLPYSPSPPAAVLLLYGAFNLVLLAGLAWAVGILIRARRRLPPETLPMAAIAVAGLGVHLPLSAEPRLLLPLVLPMIWMITQAAGLRRHDGSVA
ncbi:MAG: hypothetical protein NVSMB25_14300 [Thermoleophilaceae bacterium]